MEHLFIAAIEGLPWLDRLFRRRLAKVVPNLDELRNAPQGALATEEVRIGPGTRVATSIFLGLVCGLMLSCGMAMSIADARDMKGERTTEGRAMAVLALMVPFIAIAAFLRILRGGSMLLAPDGVFMTLRRQTVYCPWHLFDVSIAPVRSDESTLVLATNPAAAGAVSLLEDEAVIETGRSVRAKQFRFRLPTSKPLTGMHGWPEAAVRDLYRARIDEIVALLITIGRKMSSESAQTKG